MSAEARRERTVFRAVLISLGLLAAAGIIVALFPRQLFRGSLISVAPDQSVRQVDPAVLRTAALIASTWAALLAALFAWPRTHLRRWLIPAVAEVGSALAELPRRIRIFLSETPAELTVGLAIIVVFGSVLRLNLARTLPIGKDESITYVVFVSRTVLNIITDYQIPNNHVLHTLLSHLSVRSFGNTTLALRLPAVAAGILCIPATFWLASRLFDAETGLLAAGTVAVAPPMLAYSIQARGYTLLTLFFIVAFTIATYLKERSHIALWAGFVVALASSLYTVPVGVYGVIAIGTWLLLSAPKSRRPVVTRQLAVSAAAIAVLTLLLYTPILLRSGLDPIIHNGDTVALPLRPLLAAWGKMLGNFAAEWVPLNGPAFGALSIAGLAAGLARKGEKRRVVGRLMVSMLVAIAPVAVWQRIAPRPRYFVFLVPVFLICVVYGYRATILEWIERKTARGRVILAATAVGATMLSGFAELRTNMFWTEAILDDARAVVRDFSSQLARNDELVADQFSGVVYPGRYYLMIAGRSPRRFHSYQSSRTPHQLDPYRRMFVVTTSCDEVLPELGLSEATLEEEFNAPRVVARYATLCVTLVERRADRPLRPSPYPTDPWGFERLW